MGMISGSIENQSLSAKQYPLTTNFAIREYPPESVTFKWLWVEGNSGFGDRVWVSQNAPLDALMFLKSISRWGYADKIEGCAISFELKIGNTVETLIEYLDKKLGMSFSGFDRSEIIKVHRRMTMGGL